MTAPRMEIQEGDEERARIQRVRDELATLKANGAPREVIEYYLQKERITPDPPTNEHEGSTSTLGAFARSVLATAANAAQAIPGMEAVQAGARSLVRGQSYRDALNDIEGETGKIPLPLKIAGQLPAAVASSALTPGLSAAESAALFGGASQALSADPDMPLLERAVRTGAGAASGAALAKGIEGLGNVAKRAGTAVKALRAERTPEEIVLNQGAEIARTSGPAYQAFRDLGDLGETPELADLFKLRIIRQALATVKGESPVLQKLPNTDARVLDAIYKRVGSRAFSAAHGFEPGEARNALLDAIERAAQAKGGSYVAAVQGFREGKGVQDAARLGVDAVRSAVGGRASGKMLDRKSPEVFKRTLGQMVGPEREAAEGAILGETGERLRDAVKPRALEAILGTGGVAVGGPVGLGAAAIPILLRASKTANAGHRMLSAAQGVPPDVELPPGLMQSLLAALLESTRKERR